MNNLMVWTSRISKLLLVSLFVLSCGESPVDNPDPITTPGPTSPHSVTKYSIYLFSAPWCGECTAELTELKSIWASQSKETNDSVNLKMYVVTGPNKERPTPEMAASYKESLGLNFETVPDEWRWKTYRSFIQHTWNLPAAVVLDDSGKAVKVFVGPPKFTASDIVAYVTAPSSAR